MPRRWRLRTLMEGIAILAVYLAAFRLITMGPSDDLVTLWSQGIAILLLFFVMPFHVMATWAKMTTGKGSERGDP